MSQVTVGCITACAVIAVSCYSEFRLSEKLWCTNCDESPVDINGGLSMIKPHLTRQIL